MKRSAIVKVVADVLMTLFLLFLMGYQLWGEVAHEWAGAGMLVLFLAHHILNRGWYQSLFKGRYTPMRAFQVLVDMLLLAAMAAQMYSGIAMSRHVFAFLPVDGGMALARRLHILGACWGFILMRPASMGGKAGRKEKSRQGGSFKTSQFAPVPDWSVDCGLWCFCICEPGFSDLSVPAIRIRFSGL